MHGVFTTDLVSKGGYFEFGFDASHNVEIRHAGLHHHHISALLQIECHLVQGFIGIAWIHLVGLFVTALNVTGRANGISEWPVITRRILGGIGQDERVDMPC